MSDFLGHLVARSLDVSPAPAAPVVRPRLASRFEPVTPAAASVEETVEAVVAPAAPASRIENVFVAEPAAARPDPHPPGPPLPSPPLPPGEGGGRQGGRQDRKGFDSGPAFLPSPGGRGGDGRGAGGEGPPLPRPPQPGPVIKPLRIDESRRSAEPVPPPVPEPARLAPVQPAPPAPQPAPEKRPQVEPVVRRVEVEKVFIPTSGPPPAPAPPADVSAQAGPSKAEPVPVQAPPVLQPRVEAMERSPFPVRREEPAAEPVIHVTIGRIEVRATPAPKAPVRERPAARPTVDLEEYLRQRAQGDRR